jgi:two-component system, sensor histidine kinase and response regulator
MKNILVIDDEPQLRANLQEILLMSNFETMTAPNGLIGLQLMQEAIPDLIICDVNMPELDGHDVLRILRQDQLTANIPFIFLTSQGERPDVRTGMELGASDYLTKPINSNELIRTIYAQLRKRDLAEEQAELRLNRLRSNINLALPHELHTPLNGIINAADLIMRNSDQLDHHERIELAQNIRDSSMRLYALMRNFLLYSDLEVAFHSQNRSEIIRQNRKILTAPATPITVIANRIAKAYHRQDDLHLDLDAQTIAISELKLTKLMEEIIDNAFKFSRKGTAVRVIGHVVENHYHLSVVDMGRGMTAEQIANLGAYMQFDRDRYEQQGSGLGLIIARRMMALHGGELIIRSIPTEETIVTLQFPRSI